MVQKASKPKTHEVRTSYSAMYFPIELVHGVRSKFEQAVCNSLKDKKVAYGYETTVLRYVDPVVHKYTPDIVLPNGVLVELKGGSIKSSDRTKMLLVKKQNPDADIRFCLASPTRKLSPASDTTYAMWCEKHGFPWSKKTIPDDWLL